MNWTERIRGPPYFKERMRRASVKDIVLHRSFFDAENIPFQDPAETVEKIEINETRKDGDNDE